MNSNLNLCFKPSNVPQRPLSMTLPPSTPQQGRSLDCYHRSSLPPIKFGCIGTVLGCVGTVGLGATAGPLIAVVAFFKKGQSKVAKLVDFGGYIAFKQAIRKASEAHQDLNEFLGRKYPPGEKNGNKLSGFVIKAIKEGDDVLLGKLLSCQRIQNLKPFDSAIAAAFTIQDQSKQNTIIGSLHTDKVFDINQKYSIDGVSKTALMKAAHDGNAALVTQLLQDRDIARDTVNDCFTEPNLQSSILEELRQWLNAHQSA